MYAELVPKYARSSAFAQLNWVTNVPNYKLVCILFFFLHFYLPAEPLSQKLLRISLNDDLLVKKYV